MNLADYTRELEGLRRSSREEEQRFSEARRQAEVEIRRALLETPAVVLDLCDLARAVLKGELDPGRVFGGEDLEAAAQEWVEALPLLGADPFDVVDQVAALPMLFRHFEPWIERLYGEALRVREEGFDELARARHGDEERFERQALRIDEGVATRNEAMQALFEGARAFVGFIVERAYDMESDLRTVVEAGERGLRKACAKYDSRRGYRLTTYASWWIMATLERSAGVDRGKFDTVREEFEGYAQP